MEALLEKMTVPSFSYAVDTQEDCPITGEYTLPEYCPDIAVVLRCRLIPCIQSQRPGGAGLVLDGSAAVQVLYLDEDRQAVRYAEFTQGFSCSLTGPENGENLPVQLEAETKYVNCRAVGPRRLEVRGAVALTAKAVTAAQLELCRPGTDTGLYTRTKTAAVTCPVLAVEKVLTVREAMDFPDGQPAAGQLLTGDSCAVIRECKLLPGKAIVKGEVPVHQLYAAEDGSTGCLDFVLPFSQIMDISTQSEGLSCRAHVQLLGESRQCAAGPRGENTVLACEARLLIQLRLYEQREVPLLLDAFHRQYPCTLEKQDLHLCAVLSSRWEQIVLPMQLDLPQSGIQEILDVWIKPQGSQCTVQDGTAQVTGQLAIGLLVREEGQPVYYERCEDYRLELDCPGTQAKAGMTVTERRYRVTDHKLELQVGLHCALQPCACVEQPTVSSIQPQTDAPYTGSKASLKLYYAHEGENLWDIGCRCHTSPDVIREENGLDGETLREACVLLVPMEA